jgi:hypothetical protein
MFVSHFVWWLRTRGIRKRAKEAGITFDEFSEVIEWQNAGWKLSPGNIFKSLCIVKKDEDDIEDAPIEALEPKTLHPG